MFQLSFVHVVVDFHIQMVFANISGYFFYLSLFFIKGINYALLRKIFLTLQGRIMDVDIYLWNSMTYFYQHGHTMPIMNET